MKKKRTRWNTETFKEFCKNKHENKYDYSLLEYKTLNSKIKIICPKHGLFTQIANDHKNGKNCQKCSTEKNSKKLKDTTKSFLEKALKIHGKRYDYSKTKYGNNAHEKVRVICRIHGEFLISPNSHLSKKANCSKCSQISGKRKLKKEGNLGWSKHNWVKRCKKRKSFLYILRCWNKEEDFIKIGITSKSLERRYTTKKRMPYNYKIIKIIESDNPEYIYDLEKRVLKDSISFKYYPKIPFNGNTECRSLDFNYENYNYGEAH